MNKLFVIAGEDSGDLHGSRLVAALKAKDPSLKIFCAGGSLMKGEANGGFLQTTHLTTTGFTEVFKKLGDLRKLFSDLENQLRQDKPRLVIFIDNPGFNLRLAKKIHAQGIPMMYYICPQIWAWGGHRIGLIKQLFKKVLVVFKFEEELYKKNSVAVSWVGHPLKDVVPHVHTTPTKSFDAKHPHILLMPGSRRNEVHLLLSHFLQTAQLIHQKIPHARYSLIMAPSIKSHMVDQILQGSNLPIERVFKDRYSVMEKADLGLVCSGTATLECTLLNLPHIITYRTSLITYIIVKLIAKIRYIGIPNLLANRLIVPELIQYDCSPTKIADTAISILMNKTRYNTMKADLEKVGRTIGESGVAQRAAEEILK